MFVICLIFHITPLSKLMLKDVCFSCPQINVPKRNPMSTAPIIGLTYFLYFMFKILNLLLYNTLKIFVTDTLFFCFIVKKICMVQELNIMKMYAFRSPPTTVIFAPSTPLHWSSLSFSYQLAKCRYNKNSVYISVLLYKRIIFSLRHPAWIIT